jgi:hypothetical protein
MKKVPELIYFQLDQWTLTLKEELKILLRLRTVPRFVERIYNILKLNNASWLPVSKMNGLINFLLIKGNGCPYMFFG